MILSLAFLVTALAYAMVGFGGGSTYNALLVLAETDYQTIPVIALSCNILVVTGGVIQYGRAGQLDWRALAPFVALSVPMAWLGGLLPVSETLFVGLLGFALMVTVIQMLKQTGEGISNNRPAGINTWIVGLPVGGAIGFLSGIVGIGGGIFLAPILYVMGWGNPLRIAATSSAFILVNSAAGLTGQLMKHAESPSLDPWLQSWPLYIAVLLGGQIGSHLGNHRLSQVWIRRLTAVLVFYVSVRLLLRWAELFFTG
jgi:uncharacterized membrane protein YfcA